MSDNYWQAREEDKIYDYQLAKWNKELAKQYRRTLQDIKRKLSDLYDEIIESTADGTLLASDLYRYNRYYELMSALNIQLRKLGEQEITITEQRLLDMYAETSQLLDTFGTGYSTEAAQQVIDGIWCADGKHWSSRVWSNTTLLQDRIEKGIFDCVARGAKKSELIKQLQADFGVGFHEAQRIARTELSYVQNQAALNKYKEAGIEMYQLLAAHDDRTCDICAEMDGQKFRLDEAQVGVNYPPFHPNCRTTVLAVLD